VITGQQIRAARELLAQRAGIGHTLLRQFEAPEYRMRTCRRNLTRVRFMRLAAVA